jgi:hypothetical protein
MQLVAEAVLPIGSVVHLAPKGLHPTAVAVFRSQYPVHQTTKPRQLGAAATEAISTATEFSTEMLHGAKQPPRIIQEISVLSVWLMQTTAR